MSAPLPRIRPTISDVVAPTVDADVRFWKSFRNPLLIKENNAVTHISFSPTSPHDIAITSSTRVQILSAKTRQISKTISRFKETAYSAEYRNDGKLIAVGDGTGLVQVFDAATRTVLVSLQASKHRCQVAKFDPNSQVKLLTATDDQVVRLWDITSSTPTFEVKHDDYVRSASFVPNSGLIATGGYDGVVRVLDPRQGAEPVSTFKQMAPVSDVLALNETTLVSAAANKIRVFDLTTSKPIRELANFQSTVTCLAPAYDRGLLAGSVDGHMKVFDTAAPKWQVKFAWKYGGGVLSCGVSPDFKHIVAGLTSGLVSIRTRKTEPNVAQGIKAKKSVKLTKTLQSSDAKIQQGSHQELVDFNKPSKKKTFKFEKMINAFRWGDALNSALSADIPPEVTITALEELRRRGKVAVALANRDEESLEPILKWAVATISDSRHVVLVADYIGRLVDIYGSLIDQSPLLIELMGQVRLAVAKEIEETREAGRLDGMFELLAKTAA